MSLENLPLLILGVIGSSLIITGISVFLTDRQNIVSRAFLCLTLISVLWGIANFTVYESSDPVFVLNSLRAVMFTAVWFAFALFTFYLVFPKRTNPLPRWYKRALLPAACLISILTWTPLVFESVTSFTAAGAVSTVANGPGIILFGVFVIPLVIASFILLLVKTQRAQAESRAAFNLVLVGTIITFTLILVCNFVLPAIANISLLVPYGMLFIAPFIVLTAYSMLRHGLFNVKVAGTALLVYLLAILMFVEIVVTQNIYLIIFRVLILFLLLLIGVNLIRSVIREIRQREEIERLSNEKSEFMSFASHEIRNPITAMRGYASLILDGTAGQVPAGALEIAQKILVNGDTVLALISQFLNKSKLELGQISYALADIDAGKVVTSITEGFKPHAREKGLSLETKIDFPGLVARADEAKLREVIGNLIDNSIKYTKQGGITVEVEKRNGMARIIIADTGVGIPAETIPHLFQKFSRADAQKMNLLGTGLGLYLAKTFIEGMGGKIHAESDGPGKGSRFVIELGVPHQAAQPANVAVGQAVETR